MVGADAVGVVVCAKCSRLQFKMHPMGSSGGNSLAYLFILFLASSSSSSWAPSERLPEIEASQNQLISAMAALGELARAARREVRASLGPKSLVNPISLPKLHH